jgi:hypothetical protein
MSHPSGESDRASRSAFRRSFHSNRIRMQRLKPRGISPVKHFSVESKWSESLEQLPFFSLPHNSGLDVMTK